MMNSIIDYLLLYFNFWPNTVCMLATQVLLVATNKLVYNKDIGVGAIMESFFGLFYQFFNLFMTNIGANLLGLLYVEAEILRRGNNELLNEMREGIIIMNKESGMVLFVNKAAKALKIQEKKEFSLSLIDDNDLTFNQQAKLFAFVDMATFERSTTTAENLVQLIKGANDF